MELNLKGKRGGRHIIFKSIFFNAIISKAKQNLKLSGIYL
jgi:hypothetical protein